MCKNRGYCKYTELFREEKARSQKQDHMFLDKW